MSAFQLDDTRDLRRWTRLLSSTRLEGRGVGQRGGWLATEWIGRQMDKLGLCLGPRQDSRFQLVPMACSSLRSGKSFAYLLSADSESRLDGRPDFCFRSRTEQASGTACDLVFVGYGIVAPEHQWNDYACANASGKIVVVLAGEPRFGPDDRASHLSTAMSYYGRWTYKLEEAARQGAFGAIIIHDDDAAGYSFSVARSSFTSPYTYLRTSEPGLRFEAWCSEHFGRELLIRDGIELENIRKVSSLRDFCAFALKSRIMLEVRLSYREFDSRNVIGAVPGRTAPAEVVVLMAHWDHLGVITQKSGEKKIFPGAADNATGVSFLLALARRHALALPPRRTVLFIATTGEESGMLGSRYFVQNLPVPSDNMVAALNIDGILPIGRTRDLQIIGTDYCDIGDIFSHFFRRHGRRMAHDDESQFGYYYRADQLSFARVGVPAIQVMTGSDLISGGLAEGTRRHEHYSNECYHTERDRFDSRWDFSGIAEDVLLLFEATRHLANTDTWPKWRPGTSFAA